jgi:hypothetical protein
LENDLYVASVFSPSYTYIVFRNIFERHKQQLRISPARRFTARPFTTRRNGKFWSEPIAPREQPDLHLHPTTMSTHKPTSSDTILLLHGLGFFALLFALVTALDPIYIFTYSIPLGLAGFVLVVLPYSEKFQRVMQTGKSPFLVREMGQSVGLAADVRDRFRQGQ